jgi:hypothetical protein
VFSGLYVAELFQLPPSADIHEVMKFMFAAEVGTPSRDSTSAANVSGVYPEAFAAVEPAFVVAPSARATTASSRTR